MQVIARRTLRLSWDRHRSAEQPLRTWYAIAAKSSWSGPADVKRQFGRSVDFVGDSRAIFDIGGNKFRLIAYIAYPFGRVLTKFVGTHAEYDKVDPETV